VIKIVKAKFKMSGEELYIDGRRVIEVWESFNGWYWFGVERAWKQDSLIRGKVYQDDQIWFGYIQGFEEEWGCFSEKELELLSPKVWKVPKRNWAWTGRR
jgi:hypothetical protein